MTSTFLARWPRLAILLTGDFNAESARRIDGRRFLGSEDLALMFRSTLILVVRHPELASTIADDAQPITQQRGPQWTIRNRFREKHVSA